MLSDVGYADALLAREAEDGTLELIDGHLRAELSSKQKVPVLVVDLSREEADKLLVSLDPLASMAGADTTMLEALLAEVSLGSEELLAHLQTEYLGLELAQPERRTSPDTLPERVDTRTRRGDLWLLGDHRLLCGDATDKKDVATLMAGEKAALFSTDPPFAVGYSGANRPHQGKNWSEIYKEPDIKEAEGFFRAVFANALGVLRDDAAWYCWHAHKHAWLIDRLWSELGVLNHMQIVWTKPSATATYSYWPWAHEPCLMGWRKGHKPPHDGRNDHDQTSVWEVDYDGKGRLVGNEHPTQKPVELFTRPILKHTKEGDICFEPFSGSGSQIIAAEISGRRCFAMDLEPTFCDLAATRWVEFTGQKARLLRGPVPGSAASARPRCAKQGGAR